MNEFRELVEEIANVMTGWEYKPHTDDYSSRFEQISGIDGAIITLRLQQYTFDRETTRLVVSGKYPAHDGKQRHIGGGRPRITIAAKRGAVAIARDIERRLLPKYLPLYAEAVFWVQQRIDADDRDTENLIAVAEALGVLAPKSTSKRVQSQYSKNQAWGHFDAVYDGTFQVELRNVSLELALTIAQVLKASHLEADYGIQD